MRGGRTTEGAFYGSDARAASGALLRGGHVALTPSARGEPPPLSHRLGGRPADRGMWLAVDPSMRRPMEPLQVPDTFDHPGRVSMSQGACAEGNGATDWAQWMRDLGRRVRRIREFVGLSQQELGRITGFSQGAVSRLEMGKGLATPFLIVAKVHLALEGVLRALDPTILSDEMRRMIAGEAFIALPSRGVATATASIAKEPEFEELIQLYRGLSARQRQTFLCVARATARSLMSASTPGKDLCEEVQR